MCNSKSSQAAAYMTISSIIPATYSHRSTNQPHLQALLLRLHLAILLHMDMLIRLQNADLVIRKLDRETLDQRELVLDLPAVGLGPVLRFCELLWRGVLFESYLVTVSEEWGGTGRRGTLRCT